MPVKSGDLHEAILPTSCCWYTGAANFTNNYLNLFHMTQGKQKGLHINETRDYAITQLCVSSLILVGDVTIQGILLKRIIFTSKIVVSSLVYKPCHVCNSCLNLLIINCTYFSQLLRSNVGMVNISCTFYCEQVALICTN